MMDFERAFETLTGFEPFPWQRALYERFTSGQPDAIPPVASIPTGLGKTNVVAIWLLALMQCPRAIPRRLVYVVNRRTVVDQTTTEVERIRSNLAALDGPINELAISTLRGQFADNGEWYANPARPAVICGTVDMIGSRLLFSGYRIGFRSRPLQAGFLGQDALLVHDEAHLEPAFQQLVESIITEQRREQSGRELPWPGLSVMALTATARSTDDAEGFKLTDEELRPATNVRRPERPIDYVRRRLTASKTLHLHEIPKAADVAGEVAKHALSHREAGVAVLVYARTIEDVDKITAALRKKKTGVPAEQVAQLTGTMRGLERDALIETPILRRFRGEGGSDGDTVYLVCTSAGEVGIDISADHMVCDLGTFDSMTQRLGRVNRLGDRSDSRVDVVYTADIAAEPGGKDAAGGKKSDAITDARRRTLALLNELDGDASPIALESLSLEARQAAFAPAPTILPATDVLFDAWALTSIREPMPTRPIVAPYLHGIAEWEPPRTRIAWRREVSWVTDEVYERDRKAPRDILDAYPVRNHELLSDTSLRIIKELKKVADDKMRAMLPVWIVQGDGSIDRSTFCDVVDGNSTNRIMQRIADTMLIFPPEAGCLTEQGTFSATDHTVLSYDIADVPLAPDARRVERRRLCSNDRNPARADGMALLHTLDRRPDADEFAPNETDETERIDDPIDAGARFEAATEGQDCLVDGSGPLDTTAARSARFVHWFATPKMAQDPTRAAQAPVPLIDHTHDVAACAEAIASALKLPGELREAVGLAAEAHDLGKDREDWQRGIGNPTPEIPYAKSGKPKDGPRWRRAELRPYRHEFGSILDLLHSNGPHRDRLSAMSEDMRDVVLHLIAAHHGRARPHFTRAETIDLGHKPTDRKEQALEVVHRYAKLQRIYGRWGLAYLESLLRAPDWAATANPNGNGDRP